MAKRSVDLAGVFGVVTQSLADHQQELNRADEYNLDHGSNMVQTFATITEALEQKKGKSDSMALRHAAKKLAKSTSSGSGQLYAQHLAEAADQFKGKPVDEKGAMQLLQTLIGGTTGSSAPQAEASDIGDILESLSGGAAPSQQGGAAGGDLMSMLMTGLGQSGGGQAPAQQQSGLGLQKLLQAGMAFFQARQDGDSNMEALVQAFVAGSSMGRTPHREQSTQLVVDSFLQALNQYGQKH